MLNTKHLNWTIRAYTETFMDEYKDATYSASDALDPGFSPKDLTERSTEWHSERAMKSKGESTRMAFVNVLMAMEARFYVAKSESNYALVWSAIQQTMFQKMMPNYTHWFEVEDRCDDPLSYIKDKSTCT